MTIGGLAESRFPQSRSLVPHRMESTFMLGPRVRRDALLTAGETGTLTYERGPTAVSKAPALLHR